MFVIRIVQNLKGTICILSYVCARVLIICLQAAVGLISICIRDSLISLQDLKCLKPIRFICIFMSADNNQKFLKLAESKQLLLKENCLYKIELFFVFSTTPNSSSFWRMDCTFDGELALFMCLSNSDCFPRFLKRSRQNSLFL